MLKVLQVVPALDQGGVERGTLEVARALQAAGVPNAVASSGGHLVGALEAIGVRHYRLPLASKNPLTMILNGFRLARIVRADGFSLLHVRSRAPAWSVRLAAKLTGVSWLATWHGFYGRSPWWFKSRYNRIMLSGDVTIAVSEAVRTQILSAYRASPSRLVCIPRGADVTVFRPEAVSPDRVRAFRERLGVRQSVPVITLPGRLTRWKGQEVLLSAVAQLQHRSVALLFVGSGRDRKYEAELRRQAAALSDSVTTVFLAHEDDMPLVYAASDVVVNASSMRPEAFGRVLVEAQAMGRIVVATAHGGACEMIEDGVTGFLVPPGDADALARTLDRALGLSDAERRRISEAAVASVRRSFSTALTCERTLALYRSLQTRGDVEAAISASRRSRRESTRRPPGTGGTCP